ncbi:hypothetical protein GCM10011389_33370 [Pontibacillus salipaludis]|uniref:Uncharacterized protein n=1 Tax=Pontibacillus salipaludis TaxID=1697394 RepID=A0ABQ1QDG0_9BACI|nr:hypothetical protein GCM10011389_33370 [Pontibacillus salipaludis]
MLSGPSIPSIPSKNASPILSFPVGLCKMMNTFFFWLLNYDFNFIHSGSLPQGFSIIQKAIFSRKNNVPAPHYANVGGQAPR